MASSTRRRGRSLDPHKAARTDKTHTPLERAIDEFLLEQRVRQPLPPIKGQSPARSKKRGCGGLVSSTKTDQWRNTIWRVAQNDVPWEPQR